MLNEPALRPLFQLRYVGAVTHAVLCAAFSMLPWVSYADWAIIGNAFLHWRAEAIVWSLMALLAAVLLTYGVVKPSARWRIRGFAASSLFWCSALVLYYGTTAARPPLLAFLGALLASVWALVVEVRQKPRRACDV